MSKDTADFVSLIFGTLSTLSWSVAQLPQQYTNYENKSCDGISFNFLLLWFLGDLTSLIGGILTNQLKFQIYLATYFLYNDFILLFQWIYYTFIYSKIVSSNDPSSSSLLYLETNNNSPNNNNNNNRDDNNDEDDDDEDDTNDNDTNDSQNQKLTYIDGIPLTQDDDNIEYYQDNKKYNGKDETPQYEQETQDEQEEEQEEPITGSSIGKSTKNSLLKAMLASSISLSSVSNAFPITQILELASTTNTDQYITTIVKEINDNSFSSSSSSSSSSYKIGRIIAWCCTFIYLSSRIPQLYKNYQRKSVSGINCILFASAVLGNLTYTLSILSSSDFIYNSNKLKFFINELPYILGSSGTIIFDLIYFYQRSLFGENNSDFENNELLLSNSIISTISNNNNNSDIISDSLSNNLDTYYSESDEQQQNFDGFDYNENNLSKSLILLINENKNNLNDEIIYRGEVINIKKHKKNLNLINKKISKNKLINQNNIQNINNPNESTPLI